MVFPFFDVGLYFRVRRRLASELTQDILTLRSLKKVFALPVGGLALEIGENGRFAKLKIASTLIFINWWKALFIKPFGLNLSMLLNGFPCPPTGSG